MHTYNKMSTVEKFVKIVVDDIVAKIVTTIVLPNVLPNVLLPEAIIPTAPPTIMINLYSDLNHITCLAHAKQWTDDAGQYYINQLCCKPLNSKQNSEKTVATAFNKIKQFIENSMDEIMSHVQSPICSLHAGHSGKCNATIHNQLFCGFVSIPTKIDTSIYSTPGNDDYVYKNRSNRLFPIQITDQTEKLIRDKQIKLSCAIPLKDSSTPLMLAGAHLDMNTYVYNVRGVKELVRVDEFKEYLELLDRHKIVLRDRFAQIGRRVFNNEGFSICPVMGNEITVEDINRDSRVAPRSTDIQLGHCVPRSNMEFTIRGFNICLMTRDGNRFVGDENFCENKWVEKMKVAISNQH